MESQKEILKAQNIPSLLVEYNSFKQTLVNKIALINEKNIAKNNLYEIILKNISLEDKYLLSIFLFFSNYRNFISSNIENKNNGNIFVQHILNNSQINIYRILINWYFYLINSLTKEIEIFLKNNNDQDYTSKINAIRFLISESNEFIFGLFNRNRIDINQYFSFIEILILFSEEQNISEMVIYDKFIKIKNYFLLKIIFSSLESLIQTVSFQKNWNICTSNLDLLFLYLQKLTSNRSINNIYSHKILIDKNIIRSFVDSLLDVIIYNNKNIHLEIIEKYTNKVIDFYINFIKYNFKQSGLIEKMININKNSFLNLDHFSVNKNKIIQDIHFQNFYYKLLVKFDDYHLQNKINYPCTHNFLFNGKDSKLSFKLNKLNLDKTIIIFSFNFNDNNITNKTYPLITIYNESKNENLFKIYLKYNKEKSTKKNLIFTLYSTKNKLINIQINKKYYLALRFGENEKNFYIYSPNDVEFRKDIIIKKIKSTDNILKIGHDDENEKFFGLVGPIILINSPKLKKNCKIDNLIFPILKLKDNYPYILYYKNLNTIYNFDIINYFKYFSEDMNQLIKNNLSSIKGVIDNESEIECLLYIASNIINIYSKINEDELSNFQYLPVIPNVCVDQKFYYILELNISLISIEDKNTTFLSNNGLNLFILQIEYFYQLSINLLKENNDKEEYDKEFYELINIAINNLITSFYDFDDENIIYNFNTIYKNLYMNLFLTIKNLKKKSSIIIDEKLLTKLITLIIGTISKINNYWNNCDQSSNLNLPNNIQIQDNYFDSGDLNIKKINSLSIIRNGLINLLLSSNLYDKSNMKNIKLIFVSIYSMTEKILTNDIFMEKNFVWKILNFTDILESQLKENLFSNDKKSDLIEAYFALLKRYYLRNLNNELSKDYFHDLLIFTLWNCISNLYSVYNYLYLISELIYNKYYFEERDINLLINFANKLFSLPNNNFDNSLDSNDNVILISKDNEEIKPKIKEVILCILIDLVFVRKTNKDIIIKIKKFIDNYGFDEMKTIGSEIIKIYNFLLVEKATIYDINKKQDIFNNKKINLYKTEKNNNKIYWRLFKFIVILFQIILGKNDTEAKILKKQRLYELMSLLISIHDILRKNIEYDNINEDIIYCILNYIKFLHIITFDDNLNELLKENIFVKNLIDVFELAKKSDIIYSNILLKIKIDKEEIYQKTILEMILDINIKIFINNNCGGIPDMIYESLDSMFIIKNKDKINSIFYSNDILNNDLFKEKNREDMKKQYTFLKELNEIFKNEKRFEYSFCVFNLLKIGAYFIYIENNDNNNDNSPKTLKGFLNSMIYLVIDDYSELCTLNKEYSSKLNANYSLYKLLKEKLDFFHSKNKKKEKRKKSGNSKENLIELKNFFKEILKEYLKNVSISITSGDCIPKKQSLSIRKSTNSKSFKSENLKKSKKTLTPTKKDFSSNDISKINPSLSFTNQPNNNISISDSSSPKIQSLKGEETSSEFCLIEENSGNNIIFDNNNNNYNNDNNNNDNNINNDSDKKIEKNLLNDLSDNNCRNYSENSIKISDIANQSPSISPYPSNSNLGSILSLDKEDKIKIDLSKYVDEIYFFDEISINNLKNVKKQLMKNIFSIYYIDTFWYNELFEKMKIYFLNKYSEAEQNTKLLNYPTKIKNFSNGLEPPMFLKFFNNFFNNNIFKITNFYFLDYIEKHNIKNNSINIHKKTEYLLSKIQDTTEYECELIKIDYACFGSIFVGKNSNYLIFKQKESPNFTKFIEENDDNSILKYLFSYSTLKYKNKIDHLKYSKLSDKPKKTIKRDKKIVIILFDEIEEIIERRYLLMWQSVEIYLKNGKSYFFNLLNTKKKEKFLSLFSENPSLKNLIYKKDFLFKEKKMTKEWKKYYINNYKYLLLINKYASRTFNDNNQYPVFPWLLLHENDYDKLKQINNNDEKISKIFLKVYNNNNKLNLLEINGKRSYTAKNNILEKCPYKLRSLEFPVSLQTVENRREILEKYDDEDEINEDENEKGNIFKQHLGMHYSTSSYIYYYLMREQPYSDLMVKLQNYSQENPNRMFFGIKETCKALVTGKDNREIIPEFFSKIEFFINLNCVFFGYRSNNTVFVDDVKLNFFKKNDYYNSITKYIDFIIEHRKFLNGETISVNINEWIDNVFGVNQLPNDDKLRKNSYNIFGKTSYEQETNLLQKYKYLKNKKCLETKKIRTIIISEINLILNFGQTPYQVFEEKHPLRFKENIENIKNNNSEKKEINIDDDDEDYDDIESDIQKCLRTQELNFKCKKDCICFQINKQINKVFILNIDGSITIINTNLYNSEENEFVTKMFFYNEIILPDMLFYEKIKTKFGYYFIINPKYCFSSFEDSNGYQNNSNNLFSIYSKTLIDNIINNKKNNLLKKDKQKDEKLINPFYKLVTCRYVDNSFKIHLIPKIRGGKLCEKFKKPISFLCEDFVSSCCAINSNQFLIGLNNGKLIQLILMEEMKNNSNNNNLLSIKIEKYIHAHKNRINVIEINKRLGLIITAGNDNYIMLRKLYDLELLTPIKIKQKYIITMAKISPLNFLYIICFNKIKKESVIFGYTLTGMKFAKSKYGFYNNIDFTQNGNIVTFISHGNFCVLSGSELRYIQMNNNSKIFDEFQKRKEEIKNMVWVEYDYFVKKHDNEPDYNKIFTYISSKGKSLKTIDVRNYNYFD